MAKPRLCNWANRVALATVLALTGACASSGLARSDVLRQYDSVAQLDAGLTKARAQHGGVLAPEAFKKVETSLSRAIERAQDAEKDKAQQDAERGLAQLQSLSKLIDDHSHVMEEVMTTRARAEEHGASSLFEKEFGRADDKLREATRHLERNQREDAADMRSELIKRYADLELRALKRGLAAAAEEAVGKAERSGADDYAPQTLKSAQQALKLVASVLEADRTRVEKSNAHATRAIWLARRAEEITVTAKRFEKDDFSTEDVLLWYQGRLQDVRQPVTSATLPFDRPDADVVAALRDDVSSLVQSTVDSRRATKLSQDRIRDLEGQMETQATKHREALQGILDDHKAQLVALRSGNRSQIQRAKNEASKQVAELQKTLSDQAKEREQTARREEEAKARYDHVRALFDSKEADVFRQGANVLIRLKGFQFRPGKAEIESKNFSLLNKVVSAINVFPTGRVTITGHTDSIGREKTNFELSSARANSVAQFLTTIGKVPIDQLTSEGRGEAEPVASNDTKNGRATNRRIDVNIVN